MKRSRLRGWLGVELVEVSLVEKLVATIGGGLSILVLTGLSWMVAPGFGSGLIVASMGASAVLLFAVPHGPLSQPWPVVAGHGIAALIGVACARWIGWPPLAAACAVGLAIGAMHQLKCIHPPGGATALTAVIGGDAIHRLGFGYVWVPVLANALVMVGLALLINSAFRWRRYPAVLNRPAQPPAPKPAGEPPPPTHQEVLAAIQSLDSFVDITEEDLLRLTEILSRRARESGDGSGGDKPAAL